MKQILINEDNLKEEELEGTVIRVKAMLINSHGEILLAHNNGTYQLPGGHKEDEEGMEERDSMIGWAEMMGWTGRRISPKQTL